MFVLGSSFFTLLPVRLTGDSKCRSVTSQSSVWLISHDPYLDIEILLPPRINKTAPTLLVQFLLSCLKLLQAFGSRVRDHTPAR